MKTAKIPDFTGKNQKKQQVLENKIEMAEMENVSFQWKFGAEN